MGLDNARGARSGWVLWMILLLGLGLRFAYVGRPFDDRLVNSWHQSDYIQIARNFHREGPNILYPCVGRHSDAHPFAEMELFSRSCLGMVLCRMFGERFTQNGT